MGSHQEPQPKLSRTFWLVIGLVIVAVGWVLWGQFGPVDGEPSSPVLTAPAPTSGAERYIAEYGGDLSVYNRILNMSDCDALQEQFDIASENNYRYEPGTPLFTATLGYMTAADDRLASAGCY